MRGQHRHVCQAWLAASFSIALSRGVVAQGDIPVEPGMRIVSTSPSSSHSISVSAPVVQPAQGSVWKPDVPIEAGMRAVSWGTPTTSHSMPVTVSQPVVQPVGAIPQVMTQGSGEKAPADVTDPPVEAGMRVVESNKPQSASPESSTNSSSRNGKTVEPLEKTVMVPAAKVTLETSAPPSPPLAPDDVPIGANMRIVKDNRQGPSQKKGKPGKPGSAKSFGKARALAKKLGATPKAQTSNPGDIVFEPKAEIVGNVAIMHQAPPGTSVPRPAVYGAPVPTPSEGIHGVFLVFHSCGQQPRDLFEAPEERKMMTSILRRGFIILAPEAQPNENPANCWRPLSDAPGVSRMVTEFRALRGLALLPLYGVGISSGGVILGAMAYYGAPFAGCHFNVAPPQMLRAGLPPMSFVDMHYDTYGPRVAVEQAAEELKKLQVPVQVINVEPKPIADLETRLKGLGFPDDMMPTIKKFAENWGFEEKKPDGEYLALNTADQFLGRLAMDPNWAYIAKNKEKWLDLFEELHDIEGVHGATSERFDESLDFLMDPSHRASRQVQSTPDQQVPGAIKMFGGLGDHPSQGPASQLGRTCTHTFPTGKTGLAPQRILRMPLQTLEEMNAQNEWITSKVDFMCACLNVKISEEVSAYAGPMLTWLNRTSSVLKTPLPGKPDLALADIHDVICESEGKMECAQCRPWDPFGELKRSAEMNGKPSRGSPVPLNAGGNAEGVPIAYHDLMGVPQVR